MADCFESMNLYGDALVQYDELEASFFQAMKGMYIVVPSSFSSFLFHSHSLLTLAMTRTRTENNLTEFTNFGGRSPGDDNLTILSTTSKPYREQIASSTIAIFDFRIYLFARQATLLLQMGKIAELAKRAAYFISTFTRTLREHQVSLRYSLVFTSVPRLLIFSDDGRVGFIRITFSGILDVFFLFTYCGRM